MIDFRPRQRVLLPVLAAWLFAAPTVQSAQNDPATRTPASSAAATAHVERMLDALGGRDAWAGVRNTINGSMQYRAQAPTAVYAVIVLDFERPRFHMEFTGPDLYLERAVSGDTGWRRMRAGHIEDMDEEYLAGEMDWYDAHLYRTIHRLARRDETLTVTIGERDRLEVHTGGKRLMWFQLNEDGEPYAFGTREDDSGSLLGPWTFVQDGIRHPSWVSNADGSWRVAIRALSVNVPLADHLFAKPGS
jgi:hypothetical protein